MSEVNEVLARVLAAGVGEVVVCGGARNAEMIAALVAHEGVRVWRHFEERGAAFFAMGRSRDSGQPCAVVVTSGTAVAECLPAVVEAFYQNRPLVVISADRPEKFKGSGAPQVIDQAGIFREYAEAGETWSGRGPWHVNVAVEEDEKVDLAGVEIGAFLAERSKFSVAGLAQFLREDIYKGLVVMVGGLEDGEREEVFYFLKDLGAPVVADATSGLREALGAQVMVGADSYLRQNPPGKILRLGEVPVGRFWRDLEDLPQVEVFSVCRNGLSGLGRGGEVVRGEVNRVVKGMGQVDAIGDVRDDLVKAAQLRGRLDELLESFPDSEPALVRILSVYATVGESVFLGNSLPIREWQDFGQHEVAYGRVLASRGANGIDGQLSAWLGATADEEGAWGVFGDLTSLYDLTAPAFLKQVEGKGRVLVVINNDGGRIFDRLPRLEGMTEAQKEAVVQGQGVDFGQWAAMWGMDYLLVEESDDFDRLEAGEKTLMVELRPINAESDLFWKAWKNCQEKVAQA